MEENLQWKTTFNARQPSMKDDLWWKMNFNGRQLLMEVIFDEGCPLMEDDHWWKTTVASMEKDLQWKRTFNGRQPSKEEKFNGIWILMKEDLWWKTNLLLKTETWVWHWRTNSCFLYCYSIMFFVYLVNLHWINTWFHMFSVSKNGQNHWRFYECWLLVNRYSREPQYQESGGGGYHWTVTTFRKLHRDFSTGTWQIVHYVADSAV